MRGSKTTCNSLGSEMNEAFSEADSRPSGSTRTDSTGKTSGAVILGGEEEVLILEGSWEWSETVRRAWQKWSFLRISRGSLVSLTSLSLPPTAWIMLGWGQAWVGLRWLEETESIRGSTARVESLSKSAGGGGRRQLQEISLAKRLCLR